MGCADRVWGSNITRDYMLETKFGVLLQSAPVPRRRLSSKPSAALGNLWVLPCFMQELKMMQPKAREYIASSQHKGRGGPVNRC